MSAETQQMFDEFQLALEAGLIVLPQSDNLQEIAAGGVNYCPNSDLKFSKAAAETPGTLPMAAGDANQECYKFYRQNADANIITGSATALKAVGHSLFAANETANPAIPIWDRVNGQLIFGAANEPLWDVAVRLYNNQTKPGERWYASFVVGATSADLVPADLEMYCGIWIKTADYEGWAQGGNFTVKYSVVGVRGTAIYNYLVVARTDSGDILYSQILNVTDAPNTINDENFIRLSYGTARGAGFIRFEIFRETAADGTFAKIADLINTNQFTFDDIGDESTAVPAQSFPTTATGNTRAYASSRSLDVGAQDGNLITNSFTIQMPPDYNLSETLPYSQYFRFGFLRPCRVNRQIRLDKIYLGPTYNRWSDSPFDPNSALASTSQTSGVPITPGGGGPPDPGGGGSGLCIWEIVPVLRLDFEKNKEFAPYKDIRIGEPLEIGRDKPNVVLQKKPGTAKMLYKIDFTNGSTVYCNPAHGFCLDKLKKRARSAELLKERQAVWGYNNGKEGITRVKRKTKILLKKEVNVGTFSTTGDNSYICGFSLDGNSGVFCPNRKPLDTVLMEPIVS